VIAHSAFRELAAGAALDDLDHEERLSFGTHLASCSECAALERDLEDVTVGLALLATELRPPATLRADVLRAIATPPSSTTARPVWNAADHRQGPGSAARRRSAMKGRPLWGFAAVGLAAALGAVSVGATWRADALADELAFERAALAVAANPAHLTATLHAEPVVPEGDAIVVWLPGTDEAWLLADRLPATPVDRVYQLWVADAAGVHGLGTFAHDGDGPFIAPFGTALDGAAAAMVTLEPIGGAVGEPGPEIVFGEL
jgi:hypothetical protein